MRINLIKFKNKLKMNGIGVQFGIFDIDRATVLLINSEISS